MAAKVCFINRAACEIDAELARLPLVEGCYVFASGRRPAAVASHCSDNFLDVARKDPVEMTAALLPIIAVAFTVGGPEVYERRGDQFAYHETND